MLNRGLDGQMRVRRVGRAGSSSFLGKNRAGERSSHDKGVESILGRREESQGREEPWPGTAEEKNPVPEAEADSIAPELAEERRGYCGTGLGRRVG